MKKIRKFIPLSIYDIPGIESWLEEQANAGLFPVYLNSWATFEPTGIPGTRFRLEPWGKEDSSPTEEQLELTHQAGWEYAFTIEQIYFLFYTTDPKAPELYTDFESRGLSLERLEKRVKSNRRFCGILWSVYSNAPVLKDVGIAKNYLIKDLEKSIEEGEGTIVIHYAMSVRSPNCSSDNFISHKIVALLCVLT